MGDWAEADGTDRDGIFDRNGRNRKDNRSVRDGRDEYSSRGDKDIPAPRSGFAAGSRAKGDSDAYDGDSDALYDDNDDYADDGEDIDDADESDDEAGDGYIGDDE